MPRTPRSFPPVPFAARCTITRHLPFRQPDRCVNVSIYEDAEGRYCHFHLPPNAVRYEEALEAKRMLADILPSDAFLYLEGPALARVLRAILDIPEVNAALSPTERLRLLKAEAQESVTRAFRAPYQTK